MIDHVFCKAVDIERFRSTPVVGPYLDAGTSRLIERGFTDSTIRDFIRAGAKFGSFLSVQGVALRRVDENHVRAYLQYVCRARDASWPPPPAIARDRRPLLQLLGLLQEDGIVPRVVPLARSSPGPHGAALAGYLDFLGTHRGLSDSSRSQRQRYVRRFLQQIGSLPLESISAEQIDRYLIFASQTIHRRSITGVCVALRSFLRHLYLSGRVPRDLSPEVASPRIYRHETTPRSIAWPEIHRLLEAIDRTTAGGCRDYALLMLLVVYGLRACEVARLSLEDFDWERVALNIHHAKGGGRSEAPLHPEVAAAVIEYLQRVRPRSVHRTLFLTRSAPLRPMGPGAVIGRVRARLLQAGIRAPHFGSHTLRHSLAVQLLRKGFSLKAIGDLLGHRSPESTFIYTKVAIEDLRGVALDPGEVLA